MSESLVQLSSVDLRYGRRPVLSDVDLSVNEGDFIGVVGPNGSGKSTLVKGVLGLLPPARGTIRYRQGRRAMRIGYVPQREAIDSVFPVTAQELVVMGLCSRIGPLKRVGREGHEAAARALDHVGIAHLADQRFRDLSGGQQQRVLIARALSIEPRLLVLDEPTNGMDLESEHALMELIAALHDQDGLTVIMVSHMLNVLINYVDKLVLMVPPNFISGPINDVLTTDTLEQVYGTGVRIESIGDRRMVLPCTGKHELR